MNLLIALIIILCISLIIGFFTSTKENHQNENDSLHDIDAIDRLLPQTQCGDCGFKGCRPYAAALAKETTDINRCLPGGIETANALALLLGKERKPLYKDNSKYAKPAVAIIDEEICIGCVKCVRACPVDAIVGAAKQMHSVINQYCTGCELCIAPCPVDCISMVSK